MYADDVAVRPARALFSKAGLTRHSVRNHPADQTFENIIPNNHMKTSDTRVIFGLSQSKRTKSDYIPRKQLVKSHIVKCLSLSERIETFWYVCNNTQ